LIPASLSTWWGDAYCFFFWACGIPLFVLFWTTQELSASFLILMFYYVVNFIRTKHFNPILMFHFIVSFARIEHFISYFNASFCYEICKNQTIPSQCVFQFYLGNFVVQSFKSLWCFSPCCVLHPICLFVCHQKKESIQHLNSSHESTLSECEWLLLY